MNRQIVQLFGLFTLLFAAGDLHVALDRLRGPVAGGQPQQPPAADRGAEDPARADLRIGRQDGAQPRRGAGRTDLHAHLSHGRYVRPSGRLLVHRERQARARALPQRRPDGRGGRVRLDPVGLESSDREGNDVVTNLDVAGTQAAVAGLAGRKGAVVALEPQTGKVRVMVSIPEYDPNLITSTSAASTRTRTSSC